jgi:hypothetical protein
MGISVGTEGDVGDAIYCLGIIQEIPGGPHAYLFQPSSVTKTGPDPTRLCNIVAPLALKQNYISEARCVRGDEKPDWCSGEFRGKGMWCPKISLLGAKAYHLVSTKGIGQSITGKNRWLFNIDADPRGVDRVVVNRTGRYRNSYFPWREIVNFYGDRLLFVGVPHEYRDFCGEWGAIEYAKTANMLEVAQVITASHLFIGNQSSPNAVAEGLKHPTIQETSLGIPDCIFKRGNAQHVFDGSCTLPNFDGGEPLVLPSKWKASINLKENIVPPGNWQLPGHIAWGHLGVMIDQVALAKGTTDKEAVRKEIIDYNLARLPDYFADESTRHVFDVFHEAYRNAV